MRLYCGLDYYAPGDVKSLLSDEGIAGLVLGDLFCQRRMFDFGEMGFMDAVKQVWEAGREIVFQTPLYVTPDNFASVCDTLGFLHSLGGGKVLVQDVGLVQKISAEYAALVPVWNRMGRSREYTFSSEFLRFLKSCGVEAFETDSPEMAQRLSQCGLGSWLVYGNLHYRTVGRVCYTRYQTGCPEDNCAALCRRSNLRMQLADDPSFGMTVDGYILGERLRYSDWVSAAADGAETVVVYARNMEELEDRLRAFRNTAI